MKDLAKTVTLVPFKTSDVIEVTVKNKTKKEILTSVLGLTYGIIPFREWGEIGTKLEPGDKVLAYVLEMEDDRGNVILSLRRADQERLNQILSQKFKNKEPITVTVSEANYGGLLCEIGPISGFLPASQLSVTHYPRAFGDSTRILTKLKELIGQNLIVRIIGFDKKTSSPIFSEKAVPLDLTGKIKVGDVLEGIVSGITDFGIFVNLGEFDGLVHISEASWERVEDLKKIAKVGEKIKVKVIKVEDGRVFLSLKRLTPDPFEKLTKKYKEGDKVTGKVTKIAPFGILVEIKKGLEGLVKTGISKTIKEGKKYKFKIVKIDKRGRKIELKPEGGWK